MGAAIVGSKGASDPDGMHEKQTSASAEAAASDVSKEWSPSPRWGWTDDTTAPACDLAPRATTDMLGWWPSSLNSSAALYPDAPITLAVRPIDGCLYTTSAYLFTEITSSYLVKEAGPPADINHMNSPARSRTRTAASTFVLIFVMAMWLAPAAHAQIAGVGDAVGGVVGGGTDSGSGIVSGVTDPLVGGGTNSGAADDGSGDPGSSNPGPLDGVTDTVNQVVDHTTQTAHDTVTEVDNTVGNVGGGTVGETVDTVTGAVERTAGLSGHSGARSKDRDGRQKDARSPSSSGRSTSAEVLGRDFAAAMQADAEKIKGLQETSPVAFATSATDSHESVISEIGKIAAEAAQQAVFPVLLVLMVLAFLTIQSRIDSRDPKLALAPVDSEQDLLSFT
ncbi:MAG: hypothetical protein QOG16_1325 [Actinomycetota bacterium]|nr:hypothetical protein [Actinomycetota bacterium]